jgi:hypothetical protein
MHVPVAFMLKGLIYGRTGFNIISLISIGKDTSEVILNLVPRRKKFSVAGTSAVQEIGLQNYLVGKSFSAVPVTMNI